MQGKISTQDKIVNAMPFIAFGVIIVLAVAFIFMM
jgi:hypothetical protein